MEHLLIGNIKRAYDPENDIAKVTWVDSQLLTIIEDLFRENKAMKTRIEKLEGLIYGVYTPSRDNAPLPFTAENGDCPPVEERGDG